jgi:hypothetical protein
MDENPEGFRLPFTLNREAVTLGLLVIAVVVAATLAAQNAQLRQSTPPRKAPCNCPDEFGEVVIPYVADNGLRTTAIPTSEYPAGD